jgi:hypothetical protein
VFQAAGLSDEGASPQAELTPILSRSLKALKRTKPYEEALSHSQADLGAVPGDGLPGEIRPGKEAVREIKRVKQEVFIALIHRSGEAHVNFGYALAKL